MIVITNKFKIKNIKTLIKKYDIRNYSKLSKNNLIILLNRTKAVIIIQKQYRNHLRAELICPISLNELSYPFLCIKTLNKFRYYSLENFIIYLNNSKKDFRDPFTRESLSIETLNYIEKMIKYYKLGKIKSKNNWIKTKNHREEYLTLTHCINEIINDIFKLEVLNMDNLYNDILPYFIYYFNFLLLRHKHNCYGLLTNYINCLNHHIHENKYFLINYFKMVISINNL